MSHFSIEEFKKNHVAKLETRELNWIATAQEAIDPKYKRGQKAYIVGDGGNDTGKIKADHFNLRTMVIPSGCEGPLHMHDDVEEVFFVLKGNMIAMIQDKDGGEIHEIPLQDRDCISVPPNDIYRGIKNVGDEEALVLVILGGPNPHPETYPKDSDLEKLRLSQSQ